MVAMAVLGFLLPLQAQQPSPKLSGKELAGKKLFLQRCSLCHMPALNEPWDPDPQPYGPKLNGFVQGTPVSYDFENERRTAVSSLRLRVGFIAVAMTVTGGALLLPAAPATDGTALKGNIQSASGQSLEGVVVSARAGGKTYTTSVFTDEQGAYL